MASPSATPLRRQSSSNLRIQTPRNEDADLMQSLQQLSLSADPAKSPALRRKSSTPLRPHSRHASPSPSRRLSSRSPSSGRDPSVSGERTLLRKASMNSLHSANGMGPGQPSSRRSSVVLPMSPTTKAGGGLATHQEKPPVTAASIAKDCFEAELQAHHGPVSTLPTEAVVILNDAVYGHRFSRPRTSRSALNTIVERPERIKAGVLGISLAYVRLGERHSEGALPLHPKRDVHDLPSVPFRIHKTTRRLSLVSPAVTNVHGTQWMEELKSMCESAEARLARGSKELQRPERPRGEPAAEKLHEGDLYLCAESLNAIESALGAVCEAIDTVFGHGPRRAFVGVRPPGHHCSAGHPSGFCWVNNVHVGIMHAAMQHGLTHAAIIDFDLHHGDGSQSITWQHNTRAITSARNSAAWKKTSIGYFSLHDINSYPCEGGDEEKVKNASLCIDNAHGQSIWNVHLQSWKTEQDFWDLYDTKYTVLLEKTRIYLKNEAERLRAAGQAPKAAIFFSAGFDASEWESAGMQRHQVNVPTEFYARLSQDVVKLAAEEGLYVEGRVISVLEGGYSDRALFSGVFSHISGLVGGTGKVETIPSTFNGLGSEMGQKIGAVYEETDQQDRPLYFQPYDPLWWAGAELERFEKQISNPEALPKKPRQPTPATYNTPTQASTAKSSDPIKMRRSLSSLSTGAKNFARPASPPPPEVSWTVAAHELSKLLIPSDRQVDSCKPEDLNAEATRARQARQSILSGPPTVKAETDRASSRMSLRGRKAKDPITATEEVAENRSKTIGAPVAPPQKVAQSVPSTPVKPSARRASRRVSGVSTAAPTPVKESMPPPPIASGSNHPARPELAPSGRSQSATNLAVKKARPVTTAVKKEPAAKGAPRGIRKVTPAGGSAVPESPDPLAAGKSFSGGNDIDSITSGMKKIKINLITQSQKEAKERARQQEASKVASPMQEPGLPPTKEDAHVESGSANTPDTVASSLAPTADVSSPIEAGSDAKYMPLGGYTASSEVTSPEPDHKPSGTSPRTLQASTPSIPQVAISSSDAADVFVPYQPEGPPPSAVAQSEPLKWLPPNMPTPSAKAAAATSSPTKKDQTFQYTSGPIPFAPRAEGSTQNAKEESGENEQS